MDTGSVSIGDDEVVVQRDSFGQGLCPAIGEKGQATEKIFHGVRLAGRNDVEALNLPCKMPRSLRVCCGDGGCHLCANLLARQRECLPLCREAWLRIRENALEAREPLGVCGPS